MFNIVAVPHEQRAAFADEGGQLMVSMEPWITLGSDMARCRVLLTDEVKQVHVARTADGQLQGFMVLDLTGPFRSYVHILCVAPAWQGKGLATHLIGLAEDIAFQLSPNLFICVSDFNPRARQLYERLGFELCGTLKDYIVRGRDELLLRKSIGTRVEFGRGLVHWQRKNT